MALWMIGLGLGDERDVTIKTVRAKEGDSLPVDATIMEFA
jgi:diphthamide biosynthesis methyltransferase